jgi:hypothetical protein
VCCRSECPACEFFPAPVVPTSGLKVCVTDQTEDGLGFDFYQSSINLCTAWRAAGMACNATYYSGDHCMTHSYDELAVCMDDGSGRLLAHKAAAAEERSVPEVELVEVK